MAGVLSTLATISAPAMLAPHALTGTASVNNFCLGYEVWCASVQGATAADPRPTTVWEIVPYGSSMTDSFSRDNLGFSIKCTRNPMEVPQIYVSQLEYNWNPSASPPKLWYDVSNVDGYPFVDQGFTLRTNEPLTAVFNTCEGAACAPGDERCQSIYSYSTEDHTGMKACSDQATVNLDLCRVPTG